jgi:hypothetical protein
MDDLTEARSRSERAWRHLERLKELLPGRQSTTFSGDAAIIEPQPDRKSYAVRVRSIPPPTEFSLLLGDIVHDLRSSLDYVTYRLALRLGFPESARTPEELSQLRSLQFLIYDSKIRFDAAAGKIRPLVGDDAVRHMERLQTYREDCDPRGPVLWRLNSLNNIAKHRMLVAVASELESAAVAIDVGGANMLHGTIINPERRRLADGDKLFGFVLEGEQPRELNVNIVATQAIVFANTDGTCDGENVVGLLRQCCDVTASVIDDFDREYCGAAPPPL